MVDAASWLRRFTLRLGTAAGVVLLAAALAPQVVTTARELGEHETDVILLRLATRLAEQRERSGAWPCFWMGRGSQVELGSATCLPGSAARDSWGGRVLAVYQRPTARIPTAQGGVIVLISPGADGRISTSRRRAVEGHAAGDDRIHVVTRRAG